MPATSSTAMSLVREGRWALDLTFTNSDGGIQDLTTFVDPMPAGFNGAFITKMQGSIAARMTGVGGDMTVYWHLEGISTGIVMVFIHRLSVLQTPSVNQDINRRMGVTLRGPLKWEIGCIPPGTGAETIFEFRALIDYEPLIGQLAF